MAEILSSIREETPDRLKLEEERSRLLIERVRRKLLLHASAGLRDEGKFSLEDDSVMKNTERELAEVEKKLARVNISLGFEHVPPV